MNLSFFITFPRLLSSFFSHTHARPTLRFDRHVLLTSCIQQILYHMDESGIYNESDLAPFHRRLSELRWVACYHYSIILRCCQTPGLRRLSVDAERQCPRIIVTYSCGHSMLILVLQEHLAT